LGFAFAGSVTGTGTVVAWATGFEIGAEAWVVGATTAGLSFLVEQLPIAMTAANITRAPKAPAVWFLIDPPFSSALADSCFVVDCLLDKLSCVIFSSCVASRQRDRTGTAITESTD
jgi:hypothetical protein